MKIITQKTKNTKVTLVGAGPGDVELLTIKGLKAIEQADVIFYDALVNKNLLEYKKKQATCIYVGKRFNNHRYTQQNINQMLVDYAQKGNHVVRLKGGDSFVFGRGSEELNYVESYGIETEIIPGISSALAVPSNQGIPLTKRFVNESFWVITGTTSNGSISKDITYGAQSSATMVVIMGLRNMALIMHQVLKFRLLNTPFAVIQNGTLPNENIILGTIGNYQKVQAEIDYNAPGIIVIGEVVAEHQSFFDEQIQRVVELC